MIEKWISMLNLAGLVVMPYLHTFIYDSRAIRKRYITGFPKNVAQYAVFSRVSGFYPQHL